MFGSNPMNKANPYFNQIADTAHQYYDPYLQQGQQAEQGLPDFYHQMQSNPAEFYNNMLAGYKPSAGYDYKSQQMLKAAQNASAAGGYAGTAPDQEGQMALINSLLGEDMQQYINNIQGIQDRGTQGLQGYGNRGYGAANNLAESLGNNLASQGTLAYQSQSDKNAMMQQLIASLIHGGAYVLGGPAEGAGATVGAKLLGF